MVRIWWVVSPQFCHGDNKQWGVLTADAGWIPQFRVGSPCGTQQLYKGRQLANYPQWNVLFLNIYLTTAAQCSGQSAVRLQWAEWPRLGILIRYCSSRHILPPPMQHGRALQHCSTAAWWIPRQCLSRTQPGLCSHKMPPNTGSSCRDPTSSNVMIDLSIHTQFYNDHCKCIFRNQGSFSYALPLPFASQYKSGKLCLGYF